MRRKLAYILMNAALAVGVMATIGQAIEEMDTDVSYGDGKELVFRLSEKDSTIDGLEEDDYLGQKADTQNYIAINEVAEEMEDRLETWGINASITKEGYDLIRVTLRTQNDNANEYQYIADYLAFSGGNITVGAGSDDKDVESDAPSDTILLDGALFDGNTAEIDYIDDTVPVVTIEVNSQGEDGKLGELVKYCSEHTTEANEDEGTEATSCLVVFWNNKQEGDNYADATADSSSDDYDANMAKRLIFGESAANAWWTDDSDEDNNYKKLQIVPNSSALSGGSYDSSEASDAYKAALKFKCMLNADEYDYDVTYIYSHDVTASVDTTASLGYSHQQVTFGPTLIACLVAVFLSFAVCAVFYRLGSLAIMANVAVAAEGTLLLYGFFNSAFGIGALIGMALGLLATSFGSIYYFAKVKEQLYQGRTPRKAHAEAIKKALWPTLDVGIVSILIGVCVYGLIPSVSGQLGLALVISAAFGTLANLLLLRLSGWMLSASSKTEKHLLSTYGVDPAKVPNTLNEEKQTYFGPFAKKDFQKHKRVWMIAFSALLVAAIAGVSIFSAVNGNAYNYAGAYEDTTSISLEYRVNTSSTQTKLFEKIEDVQTDFLAEITYDGRTLNSMTSEEDISLETYYSYDSTETPQISYTIYHFEVALDTYFDPEETYDFLVGDVSMSGVTLDAAVGEYASNFEGLIANALKVSIAVGTPSLATVYLGLGVGILVAMVYLMLRYRLSRGLAAGLGMMGGSIIVVGAFVLSRLAVTPLVSLGAIATSVIAAFLAIFLLSKEPELVKESREHEKNTPEFRRACLIRGNGECAGDLLTFALLASAVMLSFLAIGPSSYRLIFVGAIFGTALASIYALTLITPLSLFFSKLFIKVRDSVRASRKKGAGSKGNNSGDALRKKGGEPEEAIFIGIND